MAMVGKVSEEVDKNLNAEHTITYAVTGDAQDGTVTYTVGDGDITQESGVAAGWTKDVTVKGILGANFTVTNGVFDEGTITCQILKDGTVLNENTASGAGTSATCSITSDDLKK